MRYRIVREETGGGLVYFNVEKADYQLESVMWDRLETLSSLESAEKEVKKYQSRDIVSSRVVKEYKF